MDKACSQIKEKVVVRRSGNYDASFWDYDSIQSIHNQYSGEKYENKANELKEQVNMMLGENMQHLDCLELVDNLERLGISYHFEAQIDTILNNLNINRPAELKKDLHAASLEFRFLRQHGFHVSQEIFRPFMNEDGDQFDDSLVEDVKGMLSLYEASFLSTKDETILDMAKEFTLQPLKNIKNDQTYLSCLVNHSLYLPLRWRVPRIEARWYIEVYEKSPDKNPVLLELAKLDYNILQASHQQELKHEASWLKESLIMEKLTFTRNRIVECYFWGVGVVANPTYLSSRSTTTKLGILILIIDDMYDVYGTLEELESFTVAVERWDVGVIDELPEYMKVAFLFLFNTINQIAYRALAERGVHVVKYLRTAWADLCKAYMQEVRWYYSGYTPTLEEYLKNAEVSITMQVMAVHEYVYFADPVEIMKTMETFISGHPHNIVRWISLLMRFADDLGTSAGEMERGDVAKTLQCQMNDTGCSEEEARKYVWKCYAETWKDMNDVCVHPSKRSPFLTSFARIMQNNATATLALYQVGDGLGLKSNPKTKQYIEEMLFSPIPISPNS